MGMDVYGRNPKSDVGEYFRANICTWPPILAVTKEVCHDLLPDEMWEEMRGNGGAGPEDREITEAMASRLSVWLEHHADGFTLDEPNPLVQWLHKTFAESPGELEIMTPGAVGVDAQHAGDEKLRQWVDFLQDCGGFEVH